MKLIMNSIISSGNDSKDLCSIVIQWDLQIDDTSSILI